MAKATEKRHLSALKESLAITGQGVVSAAGASPDAIVTAALKAEVSLEAEVYRAALFELNPEDRRVAAKLDRTCELALFAAREAARDARLEELDPGRIGVAAGTSRGPVGSWVDAFERLADKRPMRPTLAAAGSVAAVSGSIVAAQGLGGPSATLSATCASAAHAIATGAQWISSGMADAVIAGGAESPLDEFLLSQMRAAGLMAPPDTGIRPFDRNRAGFIPGEGAAFIVLEKASAARERGASVTGHLRGWSLRSAPSGKTGVEVDGSTLTATIGEAIARAGLQPEDIGYLNAHGTGTRANDEIEAFAIARALPGVRMSSTKAVTGHCLGATPAIEAVLCLQCLARGEFPPNSGCRDPVEECENVELLMETSSIRGVQNTLSLSSGFWGNHAALCLSC